MHTPTAYNFVALCITLEAPQGIGSTGPSTLAAGRTSSTSSSWLQRFGPVGAHVPRGAEWRDPGQDRSLAGGLVTNLVSHTTSVTIRMTLVLDRITCLHEGTSISHQVKQGVGTMEGFGHCRPRRAALATA